MQRLSYRPIHCRFITHRLFGASTSLSLVSAMLATPLFAEETGMKQRAGGLEEVVVTAQRREENLQEVPISVVAFSNELLNSGGVNATIGIPELVPSVQMVRSGPSAMFFVRGVGNTSGGTGEEGANAFYVDGVFVPDLKQTVLKFNNIERIEVLKGPQGTLFGRNSSGGLVNVITREPGQEVVGKFKLGAANYDTISGQAYLAGPLSETVSADIALTGTEQDKGWGKNLVDGADVGLGWDWGARSKWVLLPNDKAKITLAGEYTKVGDDFTTAFRLAPGSVSTGGIQAPADPFDTNSNVDQFNKQRNFGFTATVEYDFDWATLTSITGTRNNKTHTSIDPDTGPQPLAHIEINSRTKSFQEELRLASNNSGPLSWQTGFFFLQSEAELEPQATSGLAFASIGGDNAVYSTLDTTSYAIFGEATYAFATRTYLTAGIRYTRDELEFDGEQVPINAATAVPFSRTDDTSESEPTWRLALRQDITDSLNVYASYNRGYKSGTYSMSSIMVDPVDPQTIDAYEVGLKSQFFDDRLRLNLAAFHYDISDYQVRAATGVGAPAVLLNAAEVDSDGFELEFEALPWESLRLFGSFTWLDSEFSKFPFAPYTYLRPATCATGTTGALTGGAITCIQSAQGNSTPLAPEFAGNIGLSYTLFMGEAGELDFSVLYSYNDGYYFEVDNRLEQPAFETVNSSITYRPTQQWSVEFWGRNLTDETYYAQQLGSALGDVAVAAAPRTYGINLAYDF